MKKMLCVILLVAFQGILPGVVDATELDSTNPQNNQINVSDTASISATFDTLMSKGTINDTTFVIYSFLSGKSAGFYSQSKDGLTATFDPDSILFPGELMEAIVTTDVTSAQGTPLDTAYVWRFTIETVDNGDSLYHGPSWLSTTLNATCCVALGDYDNDGDLDLACGNAVGGSPGSTALYRNDGGTLTSDPVWSSTVYSTVTRGIAWGDYDGDGDLDLACGNQDDPNMIHRNDSGTLTTSPVWSSTASNTTYGIAWGDYDGDGDLDLVCGNFGQANTLYRNDDGILTTDPVWSSTPTNNTHGIAWGDYDNDGDLDLACANWYSDLNTLYRNDSGTLTTDPIWSPLTSGYTTSLAWGDYDGDGDIDLAFGYDGGVIIFRNEAGILTTTGVWSPIPGLDTYGIAWGDYDGDGDLDLACGNNGQPNTVYRNLGGTLATSAAWLSDSTYYTRGIAWGDLDGDGDLELACGNFDYQPNTVYYNVIVSEPELISTDPVSNSIDVLRNANVEATFNEAMASSAIVDTTFVVHSYQSGHMAGIYSMTNNDSTAVFNPDSLFHAGEVIEAVVTTDIESALETPLDEPYVWRFTVETVDNGDSLYRWPYWLSNSTARAYSSAWGDYDNDGDLDLAFGYIDEPNEIYRNDGGYLTKDPVWTATPADSTLCIAWGDCDGDGDLDLACGNGGRSNTIYRNDNGILTSSPIWSSTPANDTRDIAWGDYDGDGDLDLVCGNSASFGGDTTNTIYRNNGGLLTTDPVWNSTSTYNTESVAWGDCDGDGDLDLACGNWNGANTLYRNDDGTLTTDPVWSSVEVLPTSSVAWGDYDGDGDLDLVCGNYNQPNGIYRNDAGTLTSSAAWTSTPNLNTYDVAWGDVDGDGDLDLACGNFGEANVIYFNGGGTIATNPTWGTSLTYMTIDIAWGDVDGDGDLELACANYFNEPNTVYYRITVPAPALVSTDPVIGSLNVDRDENVQATFNQKMDLASFTDTSFVVHSFQTGQLFGTYSMTNSETTAVFNPDSLFHAGEVVEATLTDGITSRVGTRLDPHYVWRFTVESINNGDSLNVDADWVSGRFYRTRCVAWGDVDNDGDLDLACANWQDDEPTTIYRNNGGTLTDEPVGYVDQSLQPYSIAWGDFNGDGYPDIALGNYYSQSNTVHLNNSGNISGYSDWSSNPANNTTSVACGDYDRDGDLDLAFGNIGASNTVYRNNGGTFTADPVWTSTPVCSTQCVAWGDYDNDGDLDLICANSGAGETCNLYRNDGGWLTSNPVWSGPASAVTHSIAWGDYNSDGFVDLACGNYGGQNRVYYNDLVGGFTESWVSTPSYYTNSVAWVDYDGDGDLDLSCCNLAEQEVIYRNDNGTLTSDPVWSTNEKAGIVTRSIDWGDFDGDGDMDLACGSDAVRANKVYRSGYAVRSTAPASNALDIDLSTSMEAQFTYALNPPTVSDSSFTAYGHLSGAMTGSISTHSGNLYAVLNPDSVFHTGEVVEAILTDAIASSTGESLVHSHVWRFNIEVPAADSLLPQALKSLTITRPHAIAWGDYDRDGDLDLACAAFDVVIYRNEGGVLSMTPVWSAHPPNPVDVAWGDYDRDGDLDLACANYTMSGAANTLYRNDGDSLTSDPVWTSSDVSQTKAIAWGDCNGDGYLDLAFVNEPGVIDMGIYFNEGGTLSQDPFYDPFVGGPVSDIAWGDYDNDGDLDLATSEYGFRNSIYRNEGGEFNYYDSEIWFSQAQNWSNGVAWGDYDGDGDLDLAFANINQSNTVYENESGSFSQTPEWSSVPTNNSYCVEWVDFDGDGDLDLAFGNYDQPNTIYMNENSRLKTTPTWSSTPSNKTEGMSCGDYDGDGDMDIAFSNYWDNSIVMYLNKDIWAPSPVIDLAVVSTTDSSVTLSWTATGDDSTVGTASSYDIRYSNSLITAGNFGNADTVAGEPLPQGVGSPETFEVAGLVSGLKYYFALKAGDVDNNWSDVSNCVSALTDLGAPEITSVKDIPNDQGKRVIVSWNRSETDYNYGVEEQYIVTEYSLWRMVDDLSMMSPRERNRLLREIEWIQENAPGRETKTGELAVEKFPTAKTGKQRIVGHMVDTGRDTGPRILQSEQEFISWYPIRFDAPLVDIRFEGLLSPGTWLYISSIPALQFESYASEASTYADSTAQDIPYFTFMVSAMTDDPFNHAESVPDSGYSVDNLSPCPPQNLVLVEPNTISWDPNTEEDLDYYSIYSGAESGFEPNPDSFLSSTSDTTYTLPDSIDGYYVFVTAIDFNRNESGPSNEIRYVTGIEEDPIPMAFALYQNVPNPFNPTTTIRFDLPRAVHVKLSVYNVKGELVSTIVDEHMTEGRKEIAWTAKDKRGRAVSSGIYFYRLVAGDFVQTKKMVLLR